MSNNEIIKKVLTIAGSDCSGGAGIQADIKTITVHNMYAMSVITALTAQNTTGVYGIEEASKEIVANQIDCVFKDIEPEAVKIGMVANKEIIEAIAERLSFYNAKNIVLDPVMVSTSGSKLISDEAINTLIEKLMPISKVITPNTKEAEVLCGFKVENIEDMIKAAKKIASNLKIAVLVKGGHLSDDAIDILYENDEITYFKSERIDNPNTHGTGCTLSSAIACNLAKGEDLENSIKKAKEYLTGAIKFNLDIGEGRGPLCHTYIL